MLDRIALKTAAKQRIRSATASPVLVTLVFMLVSYIVSTVSSAVSARDMLRFSNMQDITSMAQLADISNAVSPLTSLLTLVLGVAANIWAVGYTAYALKLSRRDDADYASLLDGFRNFGRVFLLLLLEGIFTALWTLLFVIPGIIAAYRYRLAIYILLDDPTISPMDAIRVSKRLTRGYKWKLFVLDLSFIPWYLLCGLTLGILLIWKLPYFETTYANAYQAIAAASQGVPLPPPADPFQV